MHATQMLKVAGQSHQYAPALQEFKFWERFTKGMLPYEKYLLESGLVSIPAKQQGTNEDKIGKQAENWQHDNSTLNNATQETSIKNVHVYARKYINTDKD